MQGMVAFHAPPIICTNCSESGHKSKNCIHPITSYGAIVFRIRGGLNQAEMLIQTDERALESITSRIEFLLIQRRDSIGFVEIMRGKYRIGDTAYIKQQLQGTTGEERIKLVERDFDLLWEDLWGPPQDTAHSYRAEKEIARQKLEALRSSTPSLRDLIKDLPAPWETPEWGFPKGRRDLHETEYACAMRELWEETNLSEKAIYPIRNLEPLSETFFGSNAVQYSHKYYMVYAPEVVAETVALVPNSVNAHMGREVGGIGWFTLEECLQRLRPEHVEKKEVLLRASSLLRNYCPILIRPHSPTPAVGGASS
jgi:8-oxo-dGTP pyrophosphatase MutT (NUDIX family)